MTLAIRLAVAKDAAVVAEFNRLMALETEGKVLDPQVLAAGVAAVLADPSKAFYLVAEEQGAVAGQLGVTTEWSDWRNAWFWWIQSVYVAAGARRRGIFRALYEHVYQMARDDGRVIGLRLYVEENNDAAQKTYRTLGMQPMGFKMFHRFPL
jgi:ribosomal protein S18 acetylase RimI-like enzyme